MTRVSIIVDAGFFLKPSQDLGYPYAEMGYFQTAAADVRVFSDGSEVALDPSVSKLGKTGTIDFKQFRADGSLLAGAKRGDSIDKYLLSIQSLYDVAVPSPAGFDCTVRFHSGAFRCALVKNRWFKQYDPKGLTPIPTPPPRKQKTDVAHAVVAQMELNPGEYVSIARAGTEIWSSKSLPNLTDRLEIDIAADDPTAEQYYCNSIPGFSFYWVPNQGMPPPVMWP